MKKIFIISIVIFISCNFISCNNKDDEGQTNIAKNAERQYSEEEITFLAESLKVGIPAETLIKAKMPSTHIVIFTLFRKNKRGQCVKFGICEWFPRQYYEIDNLPYRYVHCVLEKKEDGSLKPFIVELKEDVSTLPEEAYQFEVTQDINIDDSVVRDLEFQKIVIKQGIYPYNSKIGKYGGYEVPLYGIK